MFNVKQKEEKKKLMRVVKKFLGDKEVLYEVGRVITSVSHTYTHPRLHCVLQFFAIAPVRENTDFMRHPTNVQLH